MINMMEKVGMNGKRMGQWDGNEKLDNNEKDRNIIFIIVDLYKCFLYFLNNIFIIIFYIIFILKLEKIKF